MIGIYVISRLVGTSLFRTPRAANRWTAAESPAKIVDLRNFPSLRRDTNTACSYQVFGNFRKFANWARNGSNFFLYVRRSTPFYFSVIHALRHSCSIYENLEFFSVGMLEDSCRRLDLLLIEQGKWSTKEESRKLIIMICYPYPHLYYIKPQF